MKTAFGFLQDAQGNRSSSRLIGLIVTIYALVQSSAIVLIGYLHNEGLMIIATSAGTAFTAIAGPVMLFLFGNKSKEVEVTKSINENSTPLEPDKQP
jgi:hypothetical protein